MGIEGEKALPPRDEIWMLQEREADVKEYFFGDAKMVLSPSTQLVDFDSLTIYKIPDSESLPFPHLAHLFEQEMHTHPQGTPILEVSL